jgi:multiple sugar transport system permease protein
MTYRRKTVLYWTLLSPLLVLVLFPFAVMLSTALKPADEVYSFPPTWLASRLAFDNFAQMWRATDFGRALVNSLVVSLGSTVVCLVVSVPVAYTLSRVRFFGDGLFRRFLILTQMLPPIVLIIGLFRLMAALGLVDQLWSLILAYAAFNVAFTVWMLQSYFQTIPRDLEEAARVDGASTLQSLLFIVLPLAAPAIGVTAIVCFVSGWNEFVLALTLLRSPQQLTLTMRVFLLVTGAYHVDWQLVMAAALATTLPAAVLFSLVQRFMVRGLAMGAVK